MFSTVNIGVRGRRDPARQGAGQPVGEIARRMAGQMTEQVAADIAGHPDKGLDPDPAREPPEQIVGRDQRDQQPECEPHRSSGGAAGERVHQELDTVLRPDRTRDGGQHGEEDHRVGNRASPQISDKERDGTMRESAEAIHYGLLGLGSQSGSGLNCGGLPLLNATLPEWPC